MRVSSRRVLAIFRKELREYRHNGFIIWTMAIFPLIFLIQPLVVVFALPPSTSAQLSHGHLLLYMLGIPAIVPAAVAAYAVVGERQQGTLEPVLTTPIRREEFLLGKALAALVPSVAIAYAVFALFLACVGLLAQPAVEGWRQDGPATYLLAVSEQAVAAPAVTRALVAAGADVLSISQSHHSLEDVYLELLDQDEEAGQG